MSGPGADFGFSPRIIFFMAEGLNWALRHLALALAAPPAVIECFDISTNQGSETVASMVVCEDGRMKRGDYRKFRVRHESPSPDERFLDDFEMPDPLAEDSRAKKLK